MKVENADAARHFPGGAFPQLDLERAFQRAARLEKSAVPLPSHRDVAEALSSKFQVGWHPGEVNTHHAGNAVAFSVSCLEIDRGRSATEAGLRPLGCQSQVKPITQLTISELAGTRFIPPGKPAIRQRTNFPHLKSFVVVRVALLHEDRGHKRPGPEVAEPGRRPAWTRIGIAGTTGSAKRSGAGLGLHRIPILGLHMESRCPDRSRIKEQPA